MTSARKPEEKQQQQPVQQSQANQSPNLTVVDNSSTVTATTTNSEAKNEPGISLTSVEFVDLLSAHLQGDHNQPGTTLRIPVKLSELEVELFKLIQDNLNDVGLKVLKSIFDKMSLAQQEVLKNNNISSTAHVHGLFTTTVARKQSLDEFLDSFLGPKPADAKAGAQQGAEAKQEAKTDAQQSVEAKSDAAKPEDSQPSAAPRMNR